MTGKVTHATELADDTAARQADRLQPTADTLAHFEDVHRRRRGCAVNELAVDKPEPGIQPRHPAADYGDVDG